MTPVALTIAGSDPSGGAGIQADLKTFHQFGVYGEAVVTLLTVQNTRGVSRVEIMPAELVREQIEAVLADIPPHAAKLGALGSRHVIEALAALAPRFDFPLVIDPVMIGKHGAALMNAEAREAFPALLPFAALLTPNLHEASALTGLKVENVADMRRAAEHLRRAGARAVLVKGGHLAGDAVDVLLAEDFQELKAARVDTPHTHGTGCTYSAAIAAQLAQRRPLAEAVEIAKAFITEAIRTNPGLGGGCGPVNHRAPTGLSHPPAENPRRGFPR